MLHDWIFDAATDEDRALLQEMIDGVGAIVMGRTSFDKNEGDGGWGDAGPVGDTPCFVVTHREPTTSNPSIYTFVTTAWPARSSRPRRWPATRSSACTARP